MNGDRHSDIDKGVLGIATNIRTYVSIQLYSCKDRVYRHEDRVYRYEDRVYRYEDRVYGYEDCVYR